MAENNIIRGLGALGKQAQAQEAEQMAMALVQEQLPQAMYNSEVDQQLGAAGKKGPKGDQGPRGLPGIRGKDGPKGDKGDEGTGITDINAYGQDLHIKLSNGTTRRVHMPIRSAPSGGISPAMPAADFQRAARVPYEDTHDIGATNVQDAISAILTSVQGNRVLIEEEISIPTYNQVVIMGTITIEDTYIIDGDLILEN